MTRNRLMRILLIIISVLILIGVVLMRCTPNSLNADGSVIDVLLSDGKTQIIAFENLSMVPGEVCEYIVRLQHSEAEQCSVSLDFREKDGEQALKYFVRVQIISGEEMICDELLADVFQKGKLVLPVDFVANTNTELKILYVMPIEVGNEAKNAETVFELRIRASNER